MGTKIFLLIIFCLFIHCKCDVDLPEGAPCTWEEAEGTCRLAKDCQTYDLDLENDQLPPVCSLKGGFPVICCTLCPGFNETGDVLWGRFKPLIITGKKHFDVCQANSRDLPYPCKAGQSYTRAKLWVEDRKCYEIVVNYALPVGGEDTKRGQFPHMALLGYGKDLESAQWLCGGSVISEKYILTAGHCASSTELGPVKWVAMGILSRSDDARFWQRYSVKRFIPHPEYRPPVKYNDIALIETEEEIDFNIDVLPACLTDEELRFEEYASATGWGKLGHNEEKADILQRVFLSRFSVEECSALYPAHRHLRRGLDDASQVCYGGKDDVKDTCEGDSGGPLQARNYKAQFCNDVIIGVTSYGRACGVARHAGIYTRVRHFMPWIETVVWPDDIVYEGKWI